MKAPEPAVLIRWLCFIKPPPEVEPNRVGQRDGLEVVADFHHPFGLAVERRPVWQAGPVWIAGPREIDPIVRHHIGNSPVFVGPERAGAVECIVNFRRVKRALHSAIRPWRGVREEIDVDRRLVMGCKQC